MTIHDHIIVGSGCTGAMAAQTLVEAGVNVCMLDVGMEDVSYKQLIPKKDFLSIRKEEKEQYKYLVGEDLEGIPSGEVSTGAQLTPPRKFMNALVEKFLKIDSKDFLPMESLALGGLGSGWGLGCCEFSKAELERCGLDENKMREAYKVVSERIGISGEKDDASRYTLGSLDNFMNAIEMDEGASLIRSKYEMKKQHLNEKGFFMGRPALALLTQDKGDRKKYQYRDMDFYSDADKSAYRPAFTIEELKKKSNFTYIANTLVLEFDEKQEHIEVACLDTVTKQHTSYYCKKLVLAPGVLGTARIVLRSLGKGNNKLPLLCNPYTYVPCIQTKMLGNAGDGRKIGFAQLTMFLDEQKNNTDVAMASIYTYRSLMLFRIIREAPLNFNDATMLMRYLMPAFVIMGIHHPEESGDDKFIQLIKDGDSGTGDKLKAEYQLSDAEGLKVNSREKKFVKAMRSLGCYAIKRIHPGHGSSIHYAGTLPFNDNGKEFTLTSSGRLNGTKNIFVADGSGFRYLPAKGLTFSLFANAHNVALNVLKDK